MRQAQTSSSKMARGCSLFSTHGPATKAGGNSYYRKIEIEEDLIEFLSSLETGYSVTFAAAVAACALSCLEHEICALPEYVRDKIWIWPVTKSERELVSDLQKQYPADPMTEKLAGVFVRAYMEQATIDEIVFAATTALQWAEHDARRGTQS